VLRRLLREDAAQGATAPENQPGIPRGWYDFCLFFGIFGSVCPGQVVRYGEDLRSLSTRVRTRFRSASTYDLPIF
jgi:hypothetical protein